MTARKYALVLRTTAADGSSRNGFVWPESGPVSCSDWSPVAECGGGLHGALWGEGDGGLFSWAADARWLVVKVLASDVVDLGGKVKFPRGEVMHCGDRLSATAHMAKHGLPGKAIIGGTATAGDYGTATAGHRGTATAGDSGTATAGDSGTATAGDYGTATAGRYGTATAGCYGIVELHWYDTQANRYRVTIGYIGEDGLASGTAYRCDDAGQIVAAA